MSSRNNTNTFETTGGVVLENGSEKSLGLCPTSQFMSEPVTVSQMLVEDGGLLG